MFCSLINNENTDQMKILRSKVCSAVLAIALITSAQVMAQLKTVVPTLPTKEALVFTLDGRELTGKVVSSMIIGGQLKSFTIKDASDVKHKFKAAEVLEVRAKMTGLEKLAVVSEKHSTNGGKIAQIKSIVNASNDDIWKKDLTIFYQVEVKPGKYSLMQLLNPGTNTVISVFPLANTQGTEDQYYLAVKGDQVIKVVKKGYAKETYSALFGDCDSFISANPVHKKLKVDGFPDHVSSYNKTCASR